MTKYYKPGDNGDFFLTVLEVVSLSQDASTGLVLVRTLLQVADC